LTGKNGLKRIIAKSDGTDQRRGENAKRGVGHVLIYRVFGPELGTK
jgi:hypothetical protein